MTADQLLGGDAAYPLLDHGPHVGLQLRESGFTKRECIAMNVLGHIAARHVQGGATFSEIAAQQAVEYADALLKELAK